MLSAAIPTAAEIETGQSGGAAVGRDGGEEQPWLGLQEMAALGRIRCAGIARSEGSAGADRYDEKCA